MSRAHIRRSAVAVGALLALVGCTAAPAATAITQTVSTTVAAPVSGPVSAPTQASVPASATPAADPSPAVTPSDEAGSGGSTAVGASTPSGPSTAAAGSAPAPVVSASPAFGTRDLSPATPLHITVAQGTIASLTLTNPAGKVVQGALSADRRSWTSGEVLGFGRTYTATGTATGTGGASTPISGTFTTVPTSAQAAGTITPGDGQTVGIAQSVIIAFPVEPQDRAAVEKRLKITTTPAVQGSWAWIHHDTGWGIDWRPRDYWPAGTKVHVEADLYGLQYAAGKFGASDLTSDFTIGRAQVVYADVASHQIVVAQGCTHANDRSSCTSTSATYPASFGSGVNNDDISDPTYVTRSGIHVVNDKRPATVMVGNADDPYHSTEYWAVRISDNGEFIHENPNTVSKQGHANVSHGCVNLSPANAKAYYDSALIGDPVEVTGTDVALSASDGDLFDWTVPWSEWQNLSALN